MDPRLHFHFVTLFPQTIEVWLTTSILGRALGQGLFAFTLHQLRDYSTDNHRSVDDSTYGGGGGMVLRIEPLVAAVEAIEAALSPLSRPEIIYFSPAGKTLGVPLLKSLAAPPGRTRHFILICGHYEGVDQRFLDHWVDLEISLGDFVLSGGELPAVAFADALIRQIDGVLGSRNAKDQESFSLHSEEENSALLEYPHYTRPPEFRGLGVPEVLRQGDHGKIEAWRRQCSRERTRRLRPDLGD